MSAARSDASLGLAGWRSTRKSVPTIYESARSRTIARRADDEMLLTDNSRPQPQEEQLRQASRRAIATGAALASEAQRTSAAAS